MTPSVCFFTACGGGEEYEFLLGAIEHHSMMGSHLVLDTSKEPKVFKNLPPTVRWVHEPLYGFGWKEFKCRTALKRAMYLAQELGAEVLVHLDCDEFFSANCVGWLFNLARDRMVEVLTHTWAKDGTMRKFATYGWHRRLWPSNATVEIALNKGWLDHPLYDGNPENHAVPLMRNGETIRAHGPFHHHVHYAVGKKSGNAVGQPLPEADQHNSVPWPEPLDLWRKTGALPSLRFS